MVDLYSGYPIGLKADIWALGLLLLPYYNIHHLWPCSGQIIYGSFLNINHGFNHYKRRTTLSFMLLQSSVFNFTFDSGC